MIGSKNRNVAFVMDCSAPFVTALAQSAITARGACFLEPSQVETRRNGSESVCGSLK